MKTRSLLLSLTGLLLSLNAAAQSIPTLNTNDWNFILVPSFSTASESTGNTLSVAGLNHSLRFAQVLDGLTAGKEKEQAIRQIYALTTTTAPGDLAPLQSIEPFAVLNNRSVMVTTVDMANPAAWDGPAGFVQQVVGNQPRGTYVLAGASATIGAIAKVLGASSAAIPAGSDYLVASGAALPLAVSGYDDGVTADASYPTITLPPKTPHCTNQKPTTFTIDPPKGFKPYTAQTVYMVRHVEAHPVPSFEDGNYVCQGQWRALGNPDRLLEAMGGQVPDYVYGPDPSNLINCNGEACSYIRATLTVAPFAVKNGLPLTLAEYDWNDGMDLAQSLFDATSPYFPHGDGQTILVGWEHDHIVAAVTDLVQTLYQNPTAAKKLPAWPFNDYDSIWILKTNEQGKLTFSNSCEHIPSASLPTTCPAFFPAGTNP
ncbi:hypothetical protein [Endothiovibrio diazotrophicus]